MNRLIMTASAACLAAAQLSTDSCAQAARGADQFNTGSGRILIVYSCPEAMRLNRKAVEALNAGKLDEAIAGFKAALKLDPGYWPARDNLALAETKKAAGVRVSTSPLAPAGGQTCGPEPVAAKPEAGNRSGSATANAMLVNAHEESAGLARYMEELRQRIKRLWAPPKGEEHRSIVVELEIDRAGKVSSLKLKESCGVPAADRAALDAIEQAAPFPPLPPDTDEEVEIELTLDYEKWSQHR